ncbi:MAG TPA: hypothetical protein VGD98_20860 [Ktedonobacteraceae bacterium]
MDSLVKKQTSETECALELSEEMLEKVLGGNGEHRGYEGHGHHYRDRDWNHHGHEHGRDRWHKRDKREFLDGLI